MTFLLAFKEEIIFRLLCFYLFLFVAKFAYKKNMLRNFSNYNLFFIAYIIIGSYFFAIAHANWKSNDVGIPIVFVSGMVLAWIFYLTKSIILTSILHFAHNYSAHLSYTSDVLYEVMIKSLINQAICIFIMFFIVKMIYVLVNNTKIKSLFSISAG